MFFDQHLKGEPALPRVTRVGIEGDKLVAEAESPKKLVAAELCYTTGVHGDNGKRPWVRTPLTVAGDRVAGDRPPPGAPPRGKICRSRRARPGSATLPCVDLRDQQFRHTGQFARIDGAGRGLGIDRAHASARGQRTGPRGP